LQKSTVCSKKIQITDAVGASSASDILAIVDKCARPNSANYNAEFRTGFNSRYGLLEAASPPTGTSGS
jgi:hypothetical protein